MTKALVTGGGGAMAGEIALRFKCMAGRIDQAAGISHCGLLDQNGSSYQFSGTPMPFNGTSGCASNSSRSLAPHVDRGEIVCRIVCNETSTG